MIDGYNMIRRIPHFKMVEREGLESGRDALLLELERYGAAHGYSITVVFDGSGRPSPESGPLPHRESFAGIDVVFSEKGQTADDAMILMVGELRSNRLENPVDIVVVSDDYGIRDAAILEGAFVRSPWDLFGAMKEGRPLFY